MTDMPPVSTLPAARASRWLAVSLAVSLALNLAVAGVVAGAALRDRGDGPPRHAAVRDLNFGPFSAALTRDQRRDLLRAVAQDGPGLRNLRGQMRDDLAAVTETLRRNPFDGAAFRQAFDTQSQRVSARADAGREALIGLVLQMSDAERTAFAERLDQTLMRRGPGQAD
jgi:Spy/CpxP family protein refolding chaperone